MPGFLRAHALSDQWPFLSDLAELELQRGLMIDRADSTPATVAELARVPAERWATLRFAPVCALRLLELRYPVHRLWLAVKEERPVGEIDLAPTATHIVTWRQDSAVFHRVLDARESAALDSVIGGVPFAEACAAVAIDDAADRAAGYLAARLKQWVTDGLLILRGGA